VYAKVQLAAIVRFVHTAPIYAHVFSIFYHSQQLSCGRNNTKIARPNYEIRTVVKYRCFRCCCEYTTYTNMFLYINSSEPSSC